MVVCMPTNGRHQCCFSTCLQLPGKATQLAWSHPQHGQLLAAGTSTGQVHIIQGPGGCSSKQPQQQAHTAGKVEQQPQQSNEGWCSAAQLQCGNAAIRCAADAHHCFPSLPPSLTLSAAPSADHKMPVHAYDRPGCCSATATLSHMDTCCIASPTFLQQDAYLNLRRLFSALLCLQHPGVCPPPARPRACNSLQPAAALKQCASSISKQGLCAVVGGCRKGQQLYTVDAHQQD